MISTIVSRLVILVFGTLYPAYASYKAVRTKNVKEYVKWMMYWIVFALFTCAETFTDVFLSWFPFYYEIKIILVLWLLSPATKGSSILYRKFVHPMLSRREQEIDDYLAKAKEQGYQQVLNLGTKGVNYATTVIMQTAIKGGGGIVNQLRKSYSLSDLTDDTDSRADVRALQDAEQSVVDPRHVRRRHSPRRSASGSSRVDMYFPEVDIRAPLSHVRSTEDVSSGYSSAEPLYVGQPPKLEPREGLVRTASVGGASRPRSRTTRASLAAKKTATVPEDSEGSESDSEVTVIQKVKRTIIVLQSESSEEFEDTIGFPAENIPLKTPEIVKKEPEIEKLLEITGTEYIPKIVENLPETVVNVPETIVKVMETVEKLPETVVNVPETIVKVMETVEKLPEIFDNVLELTIPEVVQEINVIEEKIEPDLSQNVVIKEQKIESVTEAQIQKDASVDIFEDSLETNENEPVPVPETVENKTTEPEDLSPVETTSTSPDVDSISLASISQRKGKYNKHSAPHIPEKQTNVSESNPEVVPETVDSNTPEIISLEAEKLKTAENSKIEEKPEQSNLTFEKSDPTSQTSDIETHPIKATLVLKPGVIKNIVDSSSSTSKSQIFVSQPSKEKSKSKSKHDGPISRLMMLPKKIFGSKESSSESLKEKEKRKSWQSDSRSLTPSSVEDLKSKSDTEDLYEPIEVKKSISEVDIATKRHEENILILRTLSHSPKQYRRRSRREDDFEDSD